MPAGFYDSSDGTYRIFTTRRNAEIYANAAWALSVRRRAIIEGDGTMLNVVSRLRETIDWPDSLADLQTTLLAMTNEQLLTWRTRLQRLAWLGRRNGATDDAEGFSTAWAEVRVTRDGRFAVLSWAGGDSPEPLWPIPVTVV